MRLCDYFKHDNRRFAWHRGMGRGREHGAAQRSIQPCLAVDLSTQDGGGPEQRLGGARHHVHVRQACCCQHPQGIVCHLLHSLVACHRGHAQELQGGAVACLGALGLGVARRGREVGELVAQQVTVGGRAVGRRPGERLAGG